MDVIEALRLLQLVAFPALALATLLLLARHRSRPSAFLAVSFCALATVVVGSRLAEVVGPPRVWQLVSLVSLAAFPWLLAAFAWSFEGRLPGWLRSLGALVVGLCVVLVVADPLADVPGNERRGVFVLVFVGLWTVSSLAAAVRLWRAGGSQQLIRARMRSMSLGALVLTGALLLAATPMSAEDAIVRATSQSLALLSGLLFLAGFAPPQALRLWWRRRAGRQWARVQTELIGATTPREVAAAVVDVAADLVGGEVAVVASDGRVLAHVGGGVAEIAALADDVADDRQLADAYSVVRADDVAIIVHRTPYTPMFGETEQELLSALVLQLQLALGRAELFEAHQRALAESHRSQGELQALLVGLSHDLRSPAIAIAGYTRLLREATDPDELSAMLDAVEQSSTYLDTLVSAMLELSRIGRTAVEQEPVDLQRLVTAVSGRLAVDHPEATVRVEGTLPTVVMNPTRAEQVVDNLLSNAAKHGGRPDVTITLTASQLPDGGVCVEVADDGRGIADEDRPHVFVPFRRGRSAAHGSGVGLGMVRRILELSDASIELVDSEVGTRFQLRFPPSMLADGRPDPATSTRAAATHGDTPPTDEAGTGEADDGDDAEPPRVTAGSPR